MVEFAMAIHVCCMYEQEWRQLPQSGELIVGGTCTCTYYHLSPSPSTLNSVKRT